MARKKRIGRAQYSTASSRSPRGLTLLGTAPELLMSDKTRIVFDRNARMYGRPDGSVQIIGRWRRVPGPRHLRLGEVVWDNPPGATQGVTLGTGTGAIYIAPGGVVTPTQAARLIGKSRVWTYKLIKSGKLRAVPRRVGSTVISLAEIKRMLGFDRAAGPWLVG